MENAAWEQRCTVLSVFFTFILLLNFAILSPVCAMDVKYNLTKENLNNREGQTDSKPVEKKSSS